MNAGTTNVRPQLDSMIVSLAIGQPAPWRNSQFRPPPDGGQFGAGVLNFAPGWFQRSQDVSVSILCSRIRHN
jgi:hypothetical protein